MIALDLLIDDIPPLKASETIDKALNWLDDFKVTHLPVVDGSEYQGLVSEEMLLDAESGDILLGSLSLALNRPFVYADRHIYEVMKLVSQFNLSVVPVLDLNNNYIGSTTLPHLMKLITNTASISEVGAVIILVMNENDYSLGQIAQIVESNDAKVLSAYITTATDTTEMEVTVKINRKNVQGILQTFARYDYVVKASYSEDRYVEDMKDRYDALMKYLNM